MSNIQATYDSHQGIVILGSKSVCFESIYFSFMLNLSHITNAQTVKDGDDYTLEITTCFPIKQVFTGIQEEHVNSVNMFFSLLLPSESVGQKHKNSIDAPQRRVQPKIVFV